MTLQIRKAAKEDLEALCAVYEESRKFKLSVGDTAWGETPFTVSELSEKVDEGSLYVGLLDARPVAGMLITWEDESIWGDKGSDNQAGYIHWLATSDAVRGQQAGKQMIDWAATQAKAQGKKYLRLDCPSENQKLCAYYEKLGFKEVDQVKVYAKASSLYRLDL